jgi:excisionase family DNA binding protein
MGNNKGDKIQNREEKIETGIEDINEIGWSGQEFFENRIEREWLSTKEAAHYLRLSENALRIMVHREQVKVFRFGRRLRFRLEDCKALFTRKGAVTWQ